MQMTLMQSLSKSTQLAGVTLMRVHGVQYFGWTLMQRQRQSSYSCSLAIPDGGSTLTMVRVPVLGVAVAVTHRWGHQMVLSSCE